MTTNDEHPEVELVAVCTTRDPVEAELVKNTLKDHGIDSQISGEYQAGFTGALDIEILVREGDADRAREFIEVHHPHLL
jgi:hypothetical protein